MIELAPYEFASVIPLMSGIKQAVVPYAVCEGFNPGRVFVDRRNNPQIALVWIRAGWFFLGGEPAQAEDLTVINRLLTGTSIPTAQAQEEIGLIMVTSTLAWKDYLPHLLPERKVIDIYRRTFSFDPARFAARDDWRSQIPPGFELQPITAATAERAGVLACWASIDDFLANGIGYILVEGNHIFSICKSAFTSREKVEIEIQTDEDCRRRGYATLTASALIEECLRRGKQPNWECFWDNEPSSALAGKLGYKLIEDYPVYYWEEKFSGEG
jgi:GNAT superfamily N-acetyltransferase